MARKYSKLKVLEHRRRARPKQRSVVGPTGVTPGHSFKVGTGTATDPFRTSKERFTERRKGRPSRPLVLKHKKPTKIGTKRKRALPILSQKDKRLRRELNVEQYPIVPSPEIKITRKREYKPIVRKKK